MTDFTIAFTGHRPDRLGGALYGMSCVNWVRRQIGDLFLVLQPSMVISGMAQGVDQIVAEICVSRNLPFTAAVPFPGQELRWPKFVQERYHELLKKAAKAVYVSDYGNGGNIVGKMQHRNEWMVKNCDLLVGFWDGSEGGTANCIKYAREIRRAVKVFDLTGSR